MNPMETNFAAVTIVETDKLREQPDSQLAARINELNTALEGCQQIAIAACAHTVHHAVALGQVLEEGMRRHAGEFKEWLKSTVARDEDGKPRLSYDTALRYRTLWKKRDLIFPPDGGEPAARNLTEAYIKCGLLPEPESGESGEKQETFFRLSFVAPATPIEEWPPGEVKAFLERTRPIEELRERAKLVAQG
jgi:hypothetical protein